MANQIFAVVYTDDKGNEYITGMDSEIFAQQGAGGAGTHAVGGRLYDRVADAAVPALPGSVKTRKAAMRHPTSGKLRYITVLDPTASLWAGTTTTLTIEDSDGVGATYNVDHKRSERIGRVRQRVA